MVFIRLSAVLLGLLLFCLPAELTKAEELFSCSFGQPACLDFNDKVVDDNAICFDSFTCNYAGFICNSDYDDAVREYQRLADDYNELLSYAQSLESCDSTGRTVDEIRRCVN